MSVTSGRNQTDGKATNITADAIDGRSATPLVAGMVLLALAVVAYFALGMPGMDHSASDTSHEMAGHTGHRVVDPAAFEAATLDPGTVTVNVHVPHQEIGIDGTDLAMPFDQLDEASLPADRTTPIAVYCRSGTMSAIAVQRLAELGYTDVIELDGGTEAWTASGRPMTPFFDG